MNNKGVFTTLIFIISLTLMCCKRDKNRATLKKLTLISVEDKDWVDVVKNQWQSPKRVATLFLTYLNEQDYASAKKLAAGDALQMLSMLAMLTSNEVSNTQNNDFEILFMRCDEKGKNAICEYFTSKSNAKSKIYLTKENSEWKVSRIPKEDNGHSNGYINDDVHY